MANKPEFSVDQIETLYKNGKITPSTKELLVSRIPAEKEEPSLLEGGFFNPMDKDAEEKRSIASDFLKGGYLNQEPVAPKGFAVETARAPADAVAEPAVEVERIDPSMMANVPAPAQPAQKPVDLMASSGMNSAYNQQMGAIKDIGAAQKDLGVQQASAFDEAQKTAAAYDTKVADVRKERETAYESHLKNLDLAQKDMEAKAVINPNRYWESRNTGQKISAIIGLVLGGLGGGMQGTGKNAALEVLNKAIDNDIDAQKSAFENAKGVVGEKKSAYASAMAELGNKELALLAAKSSALGITELKLKQVAAQAGSAEAEAKAKLALGQIAEEKAKVNATLQQGVQGLAAARQAVSKGVEDPSLLPKELRERMVRMPDGLYRPAINDAGAKVVNEQAMGAKKITSILLKMKELADPTVLPTVRKAKLEGLVSEYTALKKNEMMLGVMSDSDKELVERTIGNPGGLLAANSKALIDQAMSNVRFNLDATYETYVPGYKPLTVRPAQAVRK